MNKYKSLLAASLNVNAEEIKELNSLNDNGVLTIFITLYPKDMLCPYCASSHCTSKGFYQRKLLLPNDTLRNTTLIHRVRRYQCLSCHKSFREESKFSPPSLSLSYSMIHNVMNLLKEPKTTFSMVANTYNLSTSTVINVFDRYCHIPKTSSFPEVLCIDEVYTKHSNFDSKYSCVFYNFYTRKIVDIMPSRRKNYLHSYLQTFDKEVLNQVKFICMDMYSPYKDVSQYYFKKAIICVDSFHVIKLLNDSLSKLRVRIMRMYDTNSIEYYLIKQWKTLLLASNINLDNKAKYNKRLKQYVNYRKLLEMMLAIHPDLQVAYQLKEQYIYANQTFDYKKMKENMQTYIDAFTEANIPEYEDFINALTNWKEEIINSFLWYRGKRISNGIAESLNSQIKMIIYNSKGIYNHERRRKRIMYSINKEGFYI